MFVVVASNAETTTQTNGLEDGSQLYICQRATSRLWCVTCLGVKLVDFFTTSQAEFAIFINLNIRPEFNIIEFYKF